MQMFRQSPSQNRVVATLLDGINSWSIQMLLRGENRLKQSYEIQAKGQQVKLFKQHLVRG